MAEEPVIRFLFRFRDLVGPTLVEHRKVITQHGRCWWGWWKRPTEDDRAEVWDALAAEASVAKPLPVGLFDSGSGQVYIAHVQQVIKPRVGREEGAHPRVPDGETNLIPEYYRDSPFSFAWIKLVNIDDNPVVFFPLRRNRRFASKQHHGCRGPQPVRCTHETGRCPSVDLLRLSLARLTEAAQVAVVGPSGGRVFLRQAAPRGSGTDAKRGSGYRR